MNFHFDNSYERLPSDFYRTVAPTPAPAPALLIGNRDLARDLGLSDALFSDEGIRYLSGNAMPVGASSIAMAYMGHQFGYQTMLGDGRALLLGEQITPSEDRYDLQLKGAGKTPFSRGGDGRAALGPMLREYILGEGMHGLGIPTTRALAVVTTGQYIQRTRREDGAVLTRVAKSHLRVGTFEWAASRDAQHVETLWRYAALRHDPDLADAEDGPARWLVRVCERQARLIAKWMAAGFVHGVMNTDNMTISGETIDYGPCAFLDVFNPAAKFSSIDHFGRYRYENQGQIGVYNLDILGDAVAPLLDDDPEAAKEKKTRALEAYAHGFQAAYYEEMAKKLGFQEDTDTARKYVSDFLALLQRETMDYGEAFLRLTHNDRRDLSSEAFLALADAIFAETGAEGEAIRRRHNPAIWPRNYLVERAIREAEIGDTDFLFEFVELLQDPYAHSEAQLAYRDAPTIPGYTTFCGT